MKDFPIIFSAPMVIALFADRKTMTRRLAWRIKINPGGHIPDGGGGQMDYVEPHEEHTASQWQRVKPGDRLWVRENLCAMSNWGLWHDATPAPKQGQFLDDLDPRGRVILDRYAPTEATDSALVPSIYMPRWASRLTLEVTATKIERVQAISNADAVAEGCGISDHGAHEPFPALRFRDLWTNLHGLNSWNANPEVVAITVTVHRKNIDSMRSGDRTAPAASAPHPEPNLDPAHGQHLKGE